MKPTTTFTLYIALVAVYQAIVVFYDPLQAWIPVLAPSHYYYLSYLFGLFNIALFLLARYRPPQRSIHPSLTGLGIIACIISLPNCVLGAIVLACLVILSELRFAGPALPASPTKHLLDE